MIETVVFALPTSSFDEKERLGHYGALPVSKLVYSPLSFMGLSGFSVKMKVVPLYPWKHHRGIV